MVSITAKFGEPEIPHVVKTVTGPESYDATNGYTVTVAELTKIAYVLPAIETDGTSLFLVKGTASGNEVTLRFYTISANTTSGAITVSEVGDGTDLSGLTFPLVVYGASQQ